MFVVGFKGTVCVRNAAAVRSQWAGMLTACNVKVGVVSIKDSDTTKLGLPMVDSLSVSIVPFPRETDDSPEVRKLVANLCH